MIQDEMFKWKKIKKHLIEKEEYDYVERLYEGIFVVQKNRLWGYRSINNSLESPLKYANASPFSEGRGLIKCSKTGLFGFVNKSFIEIISPQFKKAWHFTEGLARVLIENRWGFIDVNGNLQIYPKYFDAGPFQNGLACVFTRQEKFYINHEDNIIQK